MFLSQNRAHNRAKYWLWVAVAAVCGITLLVNLVGDAVVSGVCADLLSEMLERKSGPGCRAWWL
jgi:hypothetical protein